MIPVYIKPYPDELMYSWINRLAKANGLSLLDFYNSYLNSTKRVNNDLTYDARALFFKVCRFVGGRLDPQELYLSTSTAAFESTRMSEAFIARYVNNSFQPRGELNSLARTMFKNIYICPECIKEDAKQYGGAYIHRAHHLSGVCVCHKHKIPLLKYCGPMHYSYELRDDIDDPESFDSETCTLDFDMNDFEAVKVTPSSDSAVAYAQYANDILKAGIITDSRKVSLIILSRMAEMGIDVDQLFAGLKRWRYRDLFEDIDGLNKKILFRKQYNGVEIVLYLMFLFPDPADAVAALKEHGTNLKKYVCPDCGKVYCAATPSRWPCPDCTSHMSDDELFKLQVSVAGGGEYIPLTPFCGMKNSVLFLNTVTGEKGIIGVQNFLYRGTRFARAISCEKEVRWEQFYNIYLRHIAEKGTSYIPQEYVYEKMYLGRWLASQRKLERLGKLQPDRRERLLAIAPDLFSDEFFPEKLPCYKEYSDKAWNSMLESYLRYIKQTGSFCIPLETSFEKHRLGMWVSQQRYLGRKGLLPPERKQKLLDIDPDFFSHDIIISRSQEERTDNVENWEFKFDLLKQYVHETGSFWVNAGTEYKGVNLGTWVCYLRVREKKGKLSPERKARLLEFDPDFFSREVLIKRMAENKRYQVSEQEWKKKRNLYKQYIEETGDPYISTYDDYRDVHLGTWICEQRTLNRQGKLSSERKKSLEELDPDFFNEEVLHERVVKHHRYYTSGRNNCFKKK